MGRSRTLRLTDWTAANNALIEYFEGNKSKLAMHGGLSRTTINKFFNQAPVSEPSFRKICLALKLTWQQVTSVELTSASLNDLPSVEVQDDRDLSDQVKERYRQKILEQHSRIQLLSGQDMGVEELYADMWLLVRPESRHFNTPESLLNSFDIEKDRLGLSKRIERISGLEIANSKPKLVILGKPGSGKTTFLKHLAVDWCKGTFQPEKIAVLIELRRVQEQTWNLIDAIGQELRLKEEEIVNLLKQGKLLVLMDGLDEVLTDELRHNVKTQVKLVSEKYFMGNRFILTCRTHMMRTIPSGFTSVEMADFSLEQVKQFVQNWFTANRKSETEVTEQWEKIYRAMTNHPDWREMTATPLLLSLICVVVQDSNNIPENRTDFYKKEIQLLLSRWNDNKDIDGWEFGSKAYRKLSIEDKAKLLIEIAGYQFENPNNFILFEQHDLANLVSEQLELANIQEGIAVLKSIEAQHGLLIERADELWSFSHFTIQEYFTVQWLTQLPPHELFQKMTNEQSKKVVKQLVKSQQPADRLLHLIKKSIDQFMRDKTRIAYFLNWLIHESDSVQIQEALDSYQSTDLEVQGKSYENEWIKQLQKIGEIYEETTTYFSLEEWEYEKIQCYYETCIFVTELINIEGAASAECRTEIEEGILLPWVALQRRYPYLYGALKQEDPTR
ncbi:NACHT domain-containing protein [Roseofilum casamattae]|uniref:NACHT domain-containing protein n=1 Tax=Roseofilum casamattae BLCC-M143 TaxID=3022442 RepID=A0ABT7BTS5_9CYAN|nr:NACHT domain-containing protein [Roseofilum casamattae]MDJ1181896.1 NACHT domain-containing protein [Roseofilum casamattae BLCC-M143]